MARIYPLFSSSKGNCIYLGDAHAGIMIDCGVSFKRASEAMSANGLPLEAVKAVFVTHTHSDHVSGLKTLVKKLGVPLYAQADNIASLMSGGKLPDGADCRTLNGSVSVEGFTVVPFVTPHDCEASCGYRVVFPDGKTAAVCTDLGRVTEEVRTGIIGCELVMIESNYDPDRLRTCSYAPYLKQRIAGECGHLSNPDCGRMLAELAQNGTRHFVLGHLSEESNTPELAERSAKNALLPLTFGRDYLLTVAKPCGGSAIAF
ncbi:Phosphoribosyl 1,2-cyclic phosphodiesterase [Ruminococcus sp. YE71]|uniref:MBL fold metallo-hydrolase n=1 Tax=unclassified Ruminococcus TaxID=2608920 RepID=UPI000889657A|nr:MULTISPECIES: MBL fold metallo-hydrolase [unclassified Ruminococcus]SDA19153.1 Phosphoribosyl 1,2-cyclic phosphodiesterase [Ruminococcus sp. YE78]SFW28581.1 Phosphoribosyl 1,2-cyclic phosphodiesterase [Ruminococcus sp. YE71]